MNKPTMIAFVTLLAGTFAAAAAGAATHKKTYVITDYGAVGDGRTLNTKAIQSAIDRCAAEGGGIVVVPAGIFLSGAVFLKQGTDLSIAKDGVLKGSIDLNDYPLVNTRWEGVEREWPAALVNATNLVDIELSGEGTIDGSGDEWLQLVPPRRGPLSPEDPSRRRPRLICFQQSRHVRIKGLHLRNQAIWCLHILYSDDVLVEDLNIRAAHNIPSSDGIDVDSSRHVRIRRCDIDVNDDDITIKSGKDADGLRVNRPSEDIVIEKCRFAYGHGGVAMGSETSGGIRNVEVRDSIAEADNWAVVRFKTQPSRGGVVENIVFRNIRIREVRQAFEFNMEWRMVGPAVPPANVLPVFRNISLINVSGTAKSAGVIRGLRDSPIENIKFKNCVVFAEKGMVIENATKMDLSGLKLTVKQGEPIINRDRTGSQP